MHQNRSTLGLLVALLFAVIATNSALAQNDRGTVKGRIADSTGAVLPGAAITLQNIATGVSQTASANESGDYNFQSLIPGIYALTVEMQGFKKLQRTNLNVDVNVTNEQSVTMELGSATETVNVEEGIQQLATTSASMGLIVEQRSMQELPLIYGNPFTLQTLAPGVSPSGVNPNIHTYDSTTASVSVNGSMLNALEYRLDGAPNNRIRLSAYTPSTEFVGQYRMETATYDSSQGHASGGFVNTSIKSGTNAFHGGAFAYYQNPTLNSKTWTLSGNPSASPTWLRYGGTLGGPIVKNKAFFFVGYERSRQAAPNPQTLTVPTLPERTGDFSALYAQDPAHTAGVTNQYQLYEPTSGTAGAGGIVTRTPIPGNIIRNISPIAKKILSYYPEPNAPGNSDGTGNFVYAGSEPDYYYSLATRADYTMTPRQSLFGHFVLSNRLQSKTNAYFYPVSGTTLTYVNKGVAIGYNFIVNPTTVVEAHLTWTRFVNSNIVNSQGLLDATSISMPSYLVDGMPGAADSFPNIAPTGFQALADKNNIASHDDITMGAVQASKLVSSHYFRTGVEYRMYNTNGGSGAGNNGAYATTGNYVTANSNAQVPSKAGFGLAQLERGILSTARLTTNADYALRSNYIAGFFMDDWKATSKLTINAGLRYEYEGPNSERYNKANTYFDFNAVNPIAAAAKANYASIAATNPALLPASQFSVNGGLRFAGEGNSERNIYTSQKLLFLPRIGFSYQPEQNTVVRGGFGLFADSVQLFILSGGNSGSTNNATLTPQQGYSATTSLNGSGDNGLTFISTLDNPFPTGFTQPTGSNLGLQTFLGQSITFQTPNPQIPYNMRWSFGMQHQFGSWLAALDYVGNHGVHVPVQRDYNAVPLQYLSKINNGYDKTTFDRLNGNVTNPFSGVIPSTASLGSSRTTVSQLLRPYPEFTGVTAYLNNGMSIYHGLQAQLNRRFQSGLSLTTSFTWSRTLDASQYLNPSDTSLWYGISQLDRPLRFATSFLYELPFGRGRRYATNNSITSAVIGGWQVQGVYQVQSGQPLNFNPGNTSPLYNGVNPVDSAWGRSGYKKSIAKPGVAGFWFDRSNWLQTTSGCATAVCSNVLPNQYQIRTFPIRFSGLRSDFLNQFDLGVQRNFPLWRESQLQIRMEAINALNHPVYTAPSTDWTSSSFGQITTQANQPRVYQFGAFIRF
ncbi:MAG: hypothetical protein JWM43_3092 [Acidobacteriaceae bacterium]|nr:hypothetical protein [Acidobacteriaceae bacterium]